MYLQLDCTYSFLVEENLPVCAFKMDCVGLLGIFSVRCLVAGYATATRDQSSDDYHYIHAHHQITAHSYLSILPIQ